MAETARMLAAKAGMRVSSGGYSNLILDSALRNSRLDQRDKAFAAALFYGTLERRITLDREIARFCSRPLEKLTPAVLESLRLGFYQILYMDSVPDSAAVSESVELVKALGAASASGFVNGVLRSFLRSGGKIDFGALSPMERLSAEYAAPLWLCEMWTAEYGPERAENALRASLGAPPVWIRVNSLRTDAAELTALLAAEGIPAEACGFLPDALKTACAAPDGTDCYKKGLFHVQDISSQLCVAALDPKPGERVYDCCAAPGGKTFTAAERMGSTGELLAGELHPKRAALIGEGAARLGLTNVKTAVGDASVYDEALGVFDKILCDVPCSGLGVIRRKPEIRFKKPEDLSGLPEIQFSIASNAARYLAPGGVLVYSTCTLSRAENEAVTERLQKECGLAPAELPEAVKPYSADGFSVTLMPGELDCDGFYFARFQKE
mgnify:FL=1